jgi:Domain of unknown function (DUF4167)
MRPGQQNRRPRGRNNGSNNSGGNNNNNQRRHQNPLARSYESNGPDVKIRGNAQHIAEKYAQLARDAVLSGDRVMAENYLQHAEHYNRIIAAAMAQQEAQNAQFRRDYDDDVDDESGEEEGDAQDNSEANADGVMPMQNGGQNQDRQNGDRSQGDRQNGDRQNNDRQRQFNNQRNFDRQNNGERNQQDRGQQDRNQQDRPMRNQQPNGERGFQRRDERPRFQQHNADLAGADQPAVEGKVVEPKTFNESDESGLARTLGLGGPVSSPTTEAMPASEEAPKVRRTRRPVAPRAEQGDASETSAIQKDEVAAE